LLQRLTKSETAREQKSLVNQIKQALVPHTSTRPSPPCPRKKPRSTAPKGSRSMPWPAPP
jgi:hypothetical protein